MSSDEQKSKNPIQDYFTDQEKGSGTELFRITDENSDIKSEVSDLELRYINVLMANDDFLRRRQLPPVYYNYYKRFLRLKVSLDRKGRQEFVQIHRKDNADETIQKLGNLNNVLGVRK